ncbi:TrmH family RNA methyltransferase [Bacillus salitolerans]|uniref:TrmH family RNA methyltransferase n=1 Tax=Bacillus salitolerans TaxID=1437434 RepID=A0ABW4LPD6_9BACI
MKQIESKKNPRVKQWKKLHTKKERDKTGLFFIEGEHLVEEALKYKDFIKELIVSESFTLPLNWNVDDVELYLVPDEVMKEISETETPQGVSAVCVQPTFKESDMEMESILLVDAVQDPGNLGTMIRTADAAGISGVILGEGSVDLFNSKVLRSSQGSIFHLPILKGNIGDWIHKLRGYGHTIYGTSLENGSPYQTVTTSRPFTLLVGNEGRGVNKEWLSFTNHNLYIPIHGKAESLNVAVATGILLYYLRT